MSPPVSIDICAHSAKQWLCRRKEIGALATAALLILLPVVTQGDHNTPPGFRLDRVYSHWMKDNWGDIKGQPLNELVIPGSHDAGTYDLGGNILVDIEHKALDPDSPMQYCRIRGWELHVCTELAQAQTETIYEQLHAGSRFLDLRFVRTLESSFEVVGPIDPLTGIPDIDIVENEGYRYRTHHSFIGPGKGEIFNDIRRFLAEPGHENEIIILSFSQMVGYDKGVAGKNSFTTQEHREFLSEFGVGFINAKGERRTLADYMVPPSMQVPTNSANELVSVSQYNLTPQQIVGNYLLGDTLVLPTQKQLIVAYPTNDGGHAQHDVYGAGSNLLWGALNSSGDWIGGVHVTDCVNRGGDWKRSPAVVGSVQFFPLSSSDCGKLFYPEPSQWQSEDSIANDWLQRLNGRGSASEKSFVSNIAFGADLNIEFILNTVKGDPDVIGWGSLESASAFTNPRAIPHLIARPRSDINIVMADDFQDSLLIAEAIRLNKKPARVTLNIRTVNETDDACDRTLEPGNDVCDFFPIMTINGNESESPESTILGPQHQRGRVIDDHDNPSRLSGTWREPFWSYTVAVLWDETLNYRISMYDDDPSPINDHLIVTTTGSFGTDTLSEIAPGGHACYRSLEWLGDGGSIFYDLFIESWDAPNGGCGPGWVAPNIQVATAPGENHSGAIVYGAYTNEPPEAISLMKSRCAPVSTNSPSGLSNYTETFRDNRVMRPAPGSGPLPVPDPIKSGDSIFGVGSTTIQCDALFSDGTRSAKTFVVNVQDQEPPRIAVPADIDNHEATELLSPLEIGTATATDNVDGELAVTGNAPNRFPVGTTVVTWSATDNGGNVATAEQLVTVVDTKAPALSAPPAVTIVAGIEGEDIGLATATDAVRVKFISNDAPNMFPAGETVVSWYAIDDAGNVGEATQLVTANKKGGGAFGYGEFVLLFLFVAVRRRFGVGSCASASARTGVCVVMSARSVSTLPLDALPDGPRNNPARNRRPVR